jgi:hypothetical protein
MDAFNERLSAEGLADITYCSGAKDPGSNPFVGKGRHENDWDATTLGEQGALQFNAAHPRHLYVDDQTRRVIDMGRL